MKLWLLSLCWCFWGSLTWGSFEEECPFGKAPEISNVGAVLTLEDDTARDNRCGFPQQGVAVSIASDGLHKRKRQDDECESGRTKHQLPRECSLHRGCLSYGLSMAQHFNVPTLTLHTFDDLVSMIVESAIFETEQCESSQNFDTKLVYTSGQKVFQALVAKIGDEISDVLMQLPECQREDRKASTMNELLQSIHSKFATQVTNFRACHLSLQRGAEVAEPFKTRLQAMMSEWLQKPLSSVSTYQKYLEEKTNKQYRHCGKNNKIN